MSLRRFLRVLVGTEDSRWLSSWAHAQFEMDHYFVLRRRGLNHKETIMALDAMWAERQS